MLTTTEKNQLEHISQGWRAFDVTTAFKAKRYDESLCKLMWEKYCGIYRQYGITPPPAPFNCHSK